MALNPLLSKRAYRLVSLIAQQVSRHSEVGSCSYLKRKRYVVMRGVFSRWTLLILSFEPVLPVLDSLLRVVIDIDGVELFQWYAKVTVQPLNSHILLAECRLC